MPVDLPHRSSLIFGSTSIPAHPQSKLATSTLYPGLPPPPGSPPSQDTASLRDGSPSSTMTTCRADAPSHSPVPSDADVFSTVQPIHTVHRRSSRLSRWILEFQTSSQPDIIDLSDVDPIGTLSNPYLAYPHLNMAAVRRSLDDADSMHDYVLVDEDVALECPSEHALHDQPLHGPAPTDIASPRSTVRLTSPQSLRHLHLSRHTVSPSPKPSSHSPSRLSIFHRSSRVDLTPGKSGSSYHLRSTSLQTSLPRNGLHVSSAPRASSWRWRPSVLGHFSSASIPDEDAHLSPGETLTDRSQSRPSISSSNTCSSITTPTTMSVHDGESESPLPSSPPLKPPSFFGSLRVRSQTGGMASQPCFRSDGSSVLSPPLRPPYPVSAPHLPERQMVPPSSPRGGVIRLSSTSKSWQNQSGVDHILAEEPNDSQPHVLYAARHGGHRLSLSSLGSPTRQTKKKRLVVSGIALNDTRRLDAIQRWCQSFGEVEQIMRMPNGDLHIDFQKAEVADTVCRVRAKVHITGAGSVHLSWITGNKRT